MFPFLSTPLFLDYFQIIVVSIFQLYPCNRHIFNIRGIKWEIFMVEADASRNTAESEGKYLTMKSSFAVIKNFINQDS